MNVWVYGWVGGWVSGWVGGWVVSRMVAGTVFVEFLRLSVRGRILHNLSILSCVDGTSEFLHVAHDSAGL